MSIPTAEQLFLQLPEYQVIVCRQCEFAVSPNKLLSHLRHSNHRISAMHGRQIQETVSTWCGIAQDPQLLQFPREVEEPIEGLHIYCDGLRCTKELDCHYVCRSAETMRKHWLTEHNFSLVNGRGRVRQQDLLTVQENREHAMKRVSCQRFFTWGPASHYMHVRSPPESQYPEQALSSPDRCIQLTQALERLYLDGQQEIESTILAGTTDEANPWLRRTWWAQYLEGVPIDRMLDLIATPAEDAEGFEAVVRTIWVTMAEVARISQTITQGTGSAIRNDAARVQHDQTAPKPLMAYMDAASIQKHVEPWQQVLLFFARTQAPNDWTTPEYEFTPRQRCTWEQFWAAAQVQTDARRAAGKLPGDPDEAMSDPTVDLWTPVQEACLDFCIELLNQRASVHEYECALVCALAVLGRSPIDGWRDANSYPPILSRVIKIARFMVLHKSVRLDPHATEILAQLRGEGKRPSWSMESPLDDEEYVFVGSPTSSPTDPDRRPHSRNGPRHPLRMDPELNLAARSYAKPRSFADWVSRQMNSFMVRGTRGPMQWMLDLRSYGLKIHYNTSTPGHVTWMGQDELLYKDLHFTMGEFRGFVHGLVGETRRILRRNLLLASGTVTIPAIPWEQLRDDPTQSKSRWSFLQDSRTKWPTDGAAWLRDRFARGETQFSGFVHPTTQELHMGKVDWYLERVVEFREKLSVVIHICAGQPARAPELLSLRHRNTDTAFRNVFIEDGMVTLATKYHKGFYASNDAKIIHRFLPREVGELLVWYLWLVLPFVERLSWYQLQLRGGQTPPSIERERTVRQWAYLWSPDPHTGREWTSDRFRQVLTRETGIGLHGTTINVSAYRNIAIGISRRFLRESSVFPQNQFDDGSGDTIMDDVDDEASMDADHFQGHIADLQAGHSSHVAGMT